MPKQSLQQTLSEVSAALKAPDELDSTDRLALMKLHDSIESLLELSSEAPKEQHVDVKVGLGSAIQRFEASHPRLASTMDALLNTLSGLGI